MNRRHPSHTPAPKPLPAPTASVWDDLRLPTEWPDDAVEVGRVLGAWGVKGWVKLLPFSADPETLLSARRWFLRPAERGARVFDGDLQVQIAHVRVHTDTLVAQIDAIADRDLAEALKGARIFVLREDFPALDNEDEFYWVDLLGLQVINREGVRLGVVKELISNGPQSVLVVQDGATASGEKATQRLIPFVDAYIDKVDRAAQSIHVDWQPDY
ncbi:16S rRNA processing protein RimM [Lampropedia hyalina DSM 16112]|uniref:Ribosome maturation factor RimM n=2 Tax=Lampropedia TaxID=198705 RepID=A0A1M5CHG7_9BURK|nr:16S rRNA processing protein RimM [Lampropedia hyalina DSM 16112]